MRRTLCSDFLCRVVIVASLAFTGLGSFAEAGTVEAISRLPSGGASLTPNNSSDLNQTRERVASDNGRYVAFVSDATNLISGQVDTNGSMDVFLYDRVTQTTVLVSHTSTSAVTTTNGFSYDPAISADGRWVVFVSTSNNQVSGQTGDSGGSEDVFLYDRQTGTVTLVSHRPGLATTPGNCCSDWPSISGDGNTVAYRSMSTNLISGQTDTNWSYDIFAWDRATNTNRLVTHTSGSLSTAANGYSWPYVMSRDGAWIAYLSDATNLLSSFTNTNTYQSDTYLWQSATGTSTLVSHAAGLPTQGGNSYPGSLSISADGRYLAHDNRSTTLVSGQSGPSGQVFLYDRVTDTNVLVSHSSASSTQGGGSFSQNAEISANGSWIVFESMATNLVAGITDTNSAYDIWVYERSTGTNTLVSHSSAVARTTTANNASKFSRISSDGGTIVFQTSATNVAGSDTNGTTDVIFYDRPSRTAFFASRSLTSATTTANNTSFANLAVNATGDAAIFPSWATNLVSLDLNSNQDVFLYSHKAVANLSITKSDGTDTVSAGQTLTWTLTVTNPGPEAVTGATVTDVFPASVSGVLWTCTAAGGATCPSSGSGNISATVDLPVGGSATFSANGILDPAASGTLSNTAEVTVPANAVDLDTANNSATDLDTIQ
ncbi:MAG TPA: hypothetical protein VMW27_30140 [Thermoanaerobaculia bacterium]|nr:hypothetical protein [Thermoanaerobaculia bacterium]